MNNYFTFQNNLASLIKAVDYSNPITNDLAVRLASNFPGVREIKQICYIFDFVNKNWKYVLDSQKSENFRSASRTIQNNFAGDCDDYSILMAALMESIGFHTRISFARDGAQGHAFAELHIGYNCEQSHLQDLCNWISSYYNTDLTLCTNNDNGNYWLNLDWFGQDRHPGNIYFQFEERTIYYPTADKPNFVLQNNCRTV